MNEREMQAEIAKMVQAWRLKHIEEYPKHSVWTHFRYNDIALGCLTCNQEERG